MYWRVWIDFNQDNDFFDPGEQVMSITGPSDGVTTANLVIPLTASTGPTRMRVSMGRNAYPSSCLTEANVDVEDYTVNLQNPVFFLNVSPPNLSLPSSSGTTSLTVSSNTTWIVSDNVNWLSVTPGSGNGDGSLTVNYSAYTGLISRQAEITIETTDGLIVRQIPVIQESADPMLEINPSVLDFSANGGSDFVSVIANQSWTVGSPGVNWIQVTPDNGTGNGTLMVQCDLNNNSTSRSASLLLTGNNGGSVMLTVTQQGNQVCGVPENLSASTIEYTKASLTWDGVNGATGYILEVRLFGTTEWHSFIVATTEVGLAGFAPCEFYEYRVRANCGNSFSVSHTFQTAGCGPYCESYGNREIQLLD
ncbi:MAG: fibronectin type III domain-containing protein [Mameliella sp.]|nr:fibronectin type III domain-containing protein [Phaeodactylibacter sp.]